MELKYKIKIENPHLHYAQISISGQRESSQKKLRFFLPSWSPGSYLMREYARHIRSFMAHSVTGEVLYYEQVEKGVFEIDFEKSELKKQDETGFEVSYQMYCHELTVRTSHIDASHAFLHGPSLLMGVLGEDMANPTLELEFPPLWSKVSTGLKDISKKREHYIYQAEDYDTLIDAPIEIGCQDTDGFEVEGKPHHLAFYGTTFPHEHNLKKDIKTIVETVAKTMGDIPYNEYLFLTHFAPDTYGGLEHLNSTALQFCSRRIVERKGYLLFLELVAHEYFHTWNVKRIRPKELGPFDYVNEAYTRMHWLTEGLTSFMDQLFVLRSGLMTLQEYADTCKDNFNRYLSIPGRKFHSLEDSSFNTWIKLYRPDENSANSSMSYYLKGGIVFFLLNVMLAEKNKSIDELLKKLWKRYKDNPSEGMVEEEVFKMLEDIAGEDVLGKFQMMLKTTEELDLEDFCAKLGWKFEYEGEDKPWLGLNPNFQGDRVTIGSVILDGPAYKSGLNAGDEIVAINGMRILKSNFNDYQKYLESDKKYIFTVSRLNYIHEVEVLVGKTPKTIKSIIIEDEAKANRYLGSVSN